MWWGGWLALWYLSCRDSQGEFRSAEGPGGLGPSHLFYPWLLSPQKLLVVGGGWDSLSVKSSAFSEVKSPSRNVFSAVLNVKACLGQSHAWPMLLWALPARSPVGGGGSGYGWAALGMGTALSEVSASVSSLCSRRWYTTFCALEGKRTPSLSDLSWSPSCLATVHESLGCGVLLVAADLHLFML